MRIAVLSDIHNNIVAFQAVLDDLRAGGGFDRLWCLGDIVGYGPRPNECVELLRSLDHAAVAGNHDLGAVGRTSLEVFNRDAAYCARWSGERLTLENRRYIERLPAVVTEGDATLVHASLRDPVWEYLVHTEAAVGSFKLLTTPYLFVGHSHRPLVFTEGEGLSTRPETFAEGTPLPVDRSRRIINPGGVGQPRDGDPRAAYAVYDTDSQTVTLFRVAYDVSAVQRDMLALGLPPRMAERLAYGW